MTSSKAAWTRSGRPWSENNTPSPLPTRPPAPTLVEEDDKRPIAGKLLGPTGSVLSVVRHGEDLPFGFQA